MSVFLLFQHGADALVGEQLDQNGMGDAAVQNVDPLHAAGDGVHAALHLGDHAAGDDPLGHQLRHVVGMKHVDEGVLVVGVPQEAPDGGQQDERVGVPRLRPRALRRRCRR